jgi:hypothetical protein
MLNSNFVKHLDETNITKKFKGTTSTNLVDAEMNLYFYYISLKSWICRLQAPHPTLLLVSHPATIFISSSPPVSHPGRALISGSVITSVRTPSIFIFSVASSLALKRLKDG